MKYSYVGHGKVWTLAEGSLTSKCLGLSAQQPYMCWRDVSQPRTRAGPREFLHFDPHDPASAAAIISCGGICPGLNCALAKPPRPPQSICRKLALVIGEALWALGVIREIVNTLWAYGVRRIYGIKGGYKGLLEPETWLLGKGCSPCCRGQQISTNRIEVGAQPRGCQGLSGHS